MAHNASSSSLNLSQGHAAIIPLWKLDRETMEKAALKGKRYALLSPSLNELQKVRGIYVKCPKPSYKIASMQAIYAPGLEKQFELQLDTLNEAARFTSSSGELPIPKDRRAKVLNVFEDLARPYSNEGPRLRFLPTWYGTVETAVEGICTIGIKPPSSDRVDGGYIGAGSYSTFEAKYASLYGDQVTLIFNWVVASSVYPVLDCDQLMGKTLKDDFDTHFAEVCLYLPSDEEQPIYKQHYPNTPNYFACRENQAMSFTEIAVRNSSCCLPRYLVKLAPIFNPHPHFIGREDLLDKMAKAMKANDAMLILHGPPQIGKSVLVDAFINKHAEEFFFIWKIDCSTADKMRESYIELEGYLRHTQDNSEDFSTEQIIQRVHGLLQQLSSTSKPWLLVYDHLEEKFTFPQGVKVLVTTCDEKLFQDLQIQFLKIPLFSEDEGCRLIERVVSKKKYSLEQMKYLISICGLYPSILDLVVTTIQNSKDLTIETFFQSDLSHLTAHFIEMKLPDRVIVNFFVTLSNLKQDVDISRKSILDTLERLGKKELVTLFCMIPDRSGLRFLERRKHTSLLANIREMTETTPHGIANLPEVKIAGYFDPEKKETLFLKESPIRQLLVLGPKDDPEYLKNLGEIKKSYKNALHRVCQAKNGKNVNIHVKQNPYSPLTEYAVHQLKDRMRGYSTPTTEFFRFHVEGQIDGRKVKKEYRVLISETIDGDPITEESKPTIENWTWEVLCSLLDRQGDGVSGNYKVKNGKLFCVDNDISFVEPIDKNKIHFTSFLFYLFPPDTALDPKALDQFCKLDINFILKDWFKDVLKKEEKYLSLFTQPELDKMWREEEFSPSMLLRKGTLSTLHTQFWYLQLEIRKRKGSGVLAMDLLNYLLSISEDFNGKNVVGGHIYLAYKSQLNAVQPDKDKDELIWDWRARHAVNRPPGSLTSKKALEASKLSKIPDLYVVDRTKQWTYQPRRAFNELLVMVTMHDEMIYESTQTNSRTFTADFTPCFDQGNKIWDEERLKSSLESLKLRLNLDKAKVVKKLTIKNCPILSGKDLTEGVLNLMLDELSIENCPKLKDIDIYNILKKWCPKLKALHIDECLGLTTLGDGLLSYTDPLVMPHLESLSLFNTSITSVKLIAPILLNLTIRNSKLIELDVKAQSRLLMDIRNPTPSNIKTSRLRDEDLLLLKDSDITEIDLSEAEVTDKGFSTIFIHKGLKKLDLSLPRHLTLNSLIELSTSLKDLDLSGWHRVRDEDINQLTRLTDLTTLNLSRCELLTNESLTILKKMKSLTFLDISECNLMDEEGEAELKKALPKLDINKI